MEGLPAHLQGLIVCRLPPRARACASATCRGWRRLLASGGGGADLWARVCAAELAEEYSGELLGATLALNNLLAVHGAHVRELNLRGFRSPVPSKVAEIFRKRLVPRVAKVCLAHSSAQGDSLYWMLLQCPLLAEVDVSGCDLDSDRAWLLNLIYFIDKEWNVLNRRVDFPALEALNVKSAFSQGQLLSSFLAVVSTTCPHLRRLSAGWISEFAVRYDLCWTPLRGLNAFAQKLTKLDLSGCAAVKVANVQGVLEASEALEHLNLACCFRLEGEVLAKVASRRLHTLNLRAGSNFQDAAVLGLLRRNPHLLRLNLSCTQVTDAVLETLPECCPKLHALDVCFCDSVTAQGLQQALLGLAQAVDMGFSGVRGVDDAVLHRIVEKHRDARALGMGSCPWVTDAGIAGIARECEVLESLFLSGNPQISAQAVDGLLLGCRHLKRLGLEGCVPRSEGSLAQFGPLEYDYSDWEW